MNTITAYKEGNNLQANTFDKSYLFKSLVCALVIHSVLVLFISWFWQQDAQQRMTALTTPTKYSAIKSYLITSQQYQSQINDTENVPQSQVTTILKPVESVAVETTALINREPAKITPTLIKKTTISPVKLNNQLREAKPKTDSTSNSSSDTVNTAASIKEAASQYIKQHHNDQLEQLIGTQTAQQNKPLGTMSEMDPQLDFIELTPKVDTSQPNTLNHRLDPNRIVKQGDYCYRVVDLATQVNPHGWGLGFAEYCGEDESKKQLTEAINNRISKVK